MSRYIDADHLRKWILSWWERTEPTSECLKGRDILNQIDREPSIDIVRCKECVYYDPPHVEDKGKRIEYKDLPKEAFDELGIGLVNMSYGVNIGGRCCVDYNCGYGEDKRVYREEGNFCSKGRRPLNSSEKPNNSTISKMEQVDEPKTQTETQNSNLTFEKDECAKEYEELGLKELKELIKADRKTEPTISKMEQVDKDINVRSKDEPKTQMKTQNSNLTFEKADEPQTDEEYINSLPWTEVGNGEQTDEPQTEEHCETCKHKDKCEGATYEYKNTEWWCLGYAPIEDEPQTDCPWK